MVQFIPPPDTRLLLPPLLACLPTAFASPRPPPALLPLLSPILRQRLQLLSSAHTTSSSDSWLPLLCWNATSAEELPRIIESDKFELHPVSGDVEIADIDELKYRRLDNETLQARVVLSEFRLGIIYLWCEGDQEGGGTGWRVSEVTPWPEKTEDGNNTWCATIGEADSKSQDYLMAEALRAGTTSTLSMPNGGAGQENGASADDNDDYWAQYDNTPSQTPAQRSPSPGGSPPPTRPTKPTSDAAHYAQYAHVQPALDNDDPSEDRTALGLPSLNNHTITSAPPLPQPHPLRPTDQLPTGPFPPLAHPHPSSSSSSSPPHSTTTSRLEASADWQSVAEIAIRQHIGASIKSLFRLARGAGMQRGEFEGVVGREVEMLGMVEGEE